MSILESRAMLASLTIKIPAARKMDKEASRETCEANHADSTAGRFWKDLLPKEALADSLRVLGEARAYHLKATLPWLDSGPRILGAKAYAPYTEKMREFKESYLDQCKPAFVASLPNWLDLARRQLGTLHKESDYPSIESLASAFVFKYRLFTMPSAADLRVDLADSQLEALRAQMESDQADIINTAMRDVWNRIEERLLAMAGKLKAYKPELGKQGSPFRDSLVESMRDLVETLPCLNVMADPALDLMTSRLKTELCHYEAQALRDDSALRNEIADKAEAILRDVSVFM